MVRLFWFVRPEKFQNKRNVLRGSPKFPTWISQRKIVFHLLFSTTSKSCAYSQTRCRLSVNQKELYMLISNGISHSGGFAYHLNKPWTNRFPPVNGKQLSAAYAKLGPCRDWLRRGTHRFWFTIPRSQLSWVHWCQTPIGHVELSSEICNCRLRV